MTILAIPNVSEGREGALLRNLCASIENARARVLDVHSDLAHNRSVLTVTADEPARLVAAMTALAREASEIDMHSHRGAHPRLGGLDVCPFVPHEDALETAVALARQTAPAIGAAGLPVYLYGEAAERGATRELPDLRRGGLQGLMQRAAAGLVPDAGPAAIDPRRGVVCVGARRSLIAFNVWLEGDAALAAEIARHVRRRDAVRALGIALEEDRSQVSMNLLDPDRVGIDAAYELVVEGARAHGVVVAGTEIVGLVAARWLPDPAKQAARRLLAPGHSIESALADR